MCLRVSERENDYQVRGHAPRLVEHLNMIFLVYTQADVSQ